VFAGRIENRCRSHRSLYEGEDYVNGVGEFSVGHPVPCGADAHVDLGVNRVLVQLEQRRELVEGEARAVQFKQACALELAELSIGEPTSFHRRATSSTQDSSASASPNQLSP
jgi:hypothetical protein